MDNQNPYTEFRLGPDDIERAAAEGVITPDDAERLIRWGFDNRFETNPSEPPAPPVEQAKGLNLVTVAYYLGAMLMISASAWFLGDKWESLGSSGVLTTALVYALFAASFGWWVRTKGYVIGGGLLITVAVCLVPLIVYSIQDIAGFWPSNDPGTYSNYYPKIHGSWIVMELATIAVAAAALWFVRFGFLTAPIGFSFWFMSMDLAALLLGDARMEGDTREWISVIVGAVTLLVGFTLERLFSKNVKNKSEDFAFWCYLFGLMAFWGGLTMMDGDSELKRAGYVAINIALIAVSIKLRRTVFLVFGAVGVHIYLGHLAYQVFQNSFFFPFVIAFLGFSLIIVTILAQRFLLKRNVS
ncbi:MAG: DUF2157 domain-containing protein [Acidobacteria bacterium]|nr:DUF2157 domain-containing protein [Acidobacteriota bacterium]